MQDVDRKKALGMTAQALAQRYGIRIVFRGNEVCTVYDDQHRPVEIHLPEIPKQRFTDEILRLMRGAIDHEAAHVRFTNASDENSFFLREQGRAGLPYIRELFNVLEDIYVEGKMMRVYHGCKNNFLNIAEDFIGDTSSFKETLNTMETIHHEYLYSLCRFVSVYTRSRQFPQSTILRDALIDVRKEIGSLPVSSDQNDLVDAIQRRIDDECPNVTCTMDNLNLACGIHDLIRQWTENNLPPPPGQDRQQSEGQQSEGQQSEGQQSEGQQSEGQQSEGQQKNKLIINAFMDIYTPEKNISVGESANKKISSLYQSNKEKGCRSPEDDIYDREKIIIKMDAQEELEARAISSQLDSQLTGLLQHYIQNYGGTSPCGQRIDMHRLHRLSSGRVDIFKRRVEKRGVNTEVIFVVDHSGSMGGERELIASQSVYAAMMCLRKIKGVRSHAVMFNNRCYVMYDPDQKLEPYRMRARGGTAVGHGILYAKTKFDLSRDMRRMLILITDGETLLPEATKDIVDETLEQGIEIYGIGIQTNRHCLDPYLSERRYRLIQDLREFPSVLFAVLREGLLNHGGPRG